MQTITELFACGEWAVVFTSLLPLYPQALGYVPTELWHEVWPRLKKTLAQKGVKVKSASRPKIIAELKALEQVKLASEVDNDPFRTLIRTILSARSKDEQTIKVSDVLFERYDTVEKLAHADAEEVARILKPIGFYHAKTRSVIGTAQRLLDRHGGQVPSTFQELTALPGVGTKVASCVMVYAFHLPAIPVDTHVHRIANRWGIVQTKEPEKTQKRLEELVPQRWWMLINALLVRFGKDICKPITPRCSQCPVEMYCPKIILGKSVFRSDV